LGSTSLFQEFMIFVADGSGSTSLTFNLAWGGMTVRAINFDVYVNQQPSLAFAGPRHCDNYRYEKSGKSGN